jgi:hypothetical protein
MTVVLRLSHFRVTALDAGALDGPLITVSTNRSAEPDAYGMDIDLRTPYSPRACRHLCAHPAKAWCLTPANRANSAPESQPPSNSSSRDFRFSKGVTTRTTASRFNIDLDCLSIRTAAHAYGSCRSPPT